MTNNMTKQKLIELQKILLGESQREYTSLFIKNGVVDGGDCDYNEINLREYPTTETAINDLMTNFEQLMKHLASRGRNFDELVINPKMQVFVKAEDYDADNKTLKDNPTYLNDKVFLTINDCYWKVNGEKINISTAFVNGYISRLYFVSFKEFILKLAERGFEIEGLSSFEDLKMNSNIGEIKVNFSNNLKKTRQP